MKTGERIELLKRLARRLAEEDWAEMDLILRQFDLRWLPESRWDESENWDNAYSYALAMLESGAEEKLLALEEYLLPASGSNPDAGDSDELWQPGKLRAFCSHVSAYRELVSSVKLQLGQYYIDCFVAHEDIEPSKHWQEEIRSALVSCHVLLAFVTDGFHESNWTDQEVGFCVARGIPILPIKCGMDPYGFISHIQAIRATECKPMPIAQAVLTTLIANPATSPIVSEAVIGGFASSSSWESARSGVYPLGRLKSISEENLKRIENALETNPKIQEGFGVPGRVKAILARHRKQTQSIDA